ncbi:chromatin modification-related protein eaf-1-like isoform x2 protein [Elysia marginata]|uniref:Chromatin modification-related protein eaf-1-like isoform x2 protein n=1 Tax=Elysia marginata TaxID=1093978 RepID=A0AAV4F0M5_9GAST|nr:chromatin modification-related protein eaf-1-like isoform x2 protein [Elysia marginata]
MVMPGRITTLSGGHASPGPQAISLQDRPVPAVRRLSQGPGTAQATASDTISSDFPRSYDAMNRTNTSPRTPPPTSRGFDGFRQHQQQFGPSSSTSPYHSAQGYQDQRQLRSGGGYTNSSRPVSAVRPQSAMAMTSPSYQSGAPSVVERPPSSLGVAWGSAYKSGTPVLKQSGADNAGGIMQSKEQNSLESRLKSLVTDSPGGSAIRFDGTSWRGQQKHQDPTQQFSLHQRSRSYGDGATLGDTYGDGHGETNDDVYSQVNKRQDAGQGFESIPGFLPPSRPNESSRTLGTDNQVSNTDKIPLGAKESQGSSGYDLRSAWQRLYGNRPSGGAATPHSRRQSIEDSIDSSTAGDTSHFIRSSSQRLPQNTHQTSYQVKPSSHQHAHSEDPSIAAKPQLNLSYDKTPNVHAVSSPNRVSERNDYSNSYLLLPPPTDTLSGGRESPTGQSSSNPDQISGSNNSSQLSGISMVSNKFTTFKPEKKKKQTNSFDVNQYRDVSTPLGPAAKYPEMQHQQRDLYSGTSHGAVAPRSKSPGFQRHQRNSPHQAHRNRPLSSSPHGDMSNPRRHRSNSQSSEGTAEFVVRGEGKRYDFNRPMNSSRDPTALFNDSDDEDNLAAEYQINNLDSVFDFPLDDEDLGHKETAGSDHDGSVSPPLPPLSSLQEAPSRSPARPYVRGDASMHKYSMPSASADTPQPDRIDLNNQELRGSASAGHAKAGFRAKPARPAHAKETRHHKTSLTDYARSRSLEDVRESGNESVISFDVEDTMLMVEPSDQSEMGTLRSQTGGSSVRAQLNRLEGMYSQVMRSLEDRQGSSPGGGKRGDDGGRARARRRWSIGSSDTSSVRRHHHHHHHHQHGHREHHGSGGSRHSRGAAAGDSDGSYIDGKSGRAIGKRFQRLESHVITLARSVAHLSSELRSHNSMSREMENVKREILELKKSRDTPDRYNLQTPGHFMGDNHRLLTEFERYKGWVPSLTNPRRVNKLTKFFGQEPPLLEIFMRRLGYEFPEILTPHFNNPLSKHGVEHHVTHGPPTHAHARRLDKDKLSAAKAEFLKMEEMGIVRTLWRLPVSQRID